MGGWGRSNAVKKKYRGDLRSAPTRPPPGPAAGRPSGPLYDDTGTFCPLIALGRAPGGGGSAAWAGGTIGASLAHGDLLNTYLGGQVPWHAPIVPQASVVEVRPSRVGQRPVGIQPSGRFRAGAAI